MGGTIGNNNAGKGKLFRDALRYQIAKIGRECEGDETALVKGMRRVAKPLVEAAAEKDDLSAVREIADRVDGKSSQSMFVDLDDSADVMEDITEEEAVAINKALDATY